MTREEASAKRKAGAAGWLAGWNLGRPFDGSTDWRNLTFYTPVIEKAIEPVFDPQKESCSAIAFGDFNRKSGLSGPLSGSFGNPFRETGYSLWQSLTAHPVPGEAAAIAAKAASENFSGEAIWAAAFWAAAIAAAPFETSVEACLLRGMSAIPENSKLQRIPKGLIDAKRAGCDWQLCRERLLEWLKVHPEDAQAAFGFAYIACLYGDGDFGKSLCIAAGCGGAASAQAAAVGALVAAGVGVIPTEWESPTLSCALPNQISTEAQQAFQEERFTSFFDPPTPAEGEQPLSPDRSFLDDFSAIRRLHTRRQNESVVESARLSLAVSYPDGVCAPRGTNHSLALRITNNSNEPIEVLPSISASETVSIAHRAVKVRVEPLASTQLAVIANAAVESKNPHVQVLAEDVQLRAPLLQTTSCWIASPFDNRAQLGYDRAFAPETDLSPTAVYKGRSDLLVRWCEYQLCGVELDLEPHFLSAPGVLYLTAELLFDTPDLNAIIASPVGQIVWVNGEKRSWYHDTHITWPKPKAPYLTPMKNDGWTRLLIKILRNDQALAPTVIYFTTQSGEVVRPIASRQPLTG